MKKMANLFKKRLHREIIDELSDAVVAAAIDAMDVAHGDGYESAVLHKSTRGIGVTYYAGSKDGDSGEWHLVIDHNVYMTIRESSVVGASEVMTSAILVYLG